MKHPKAPARGRRATARAVQAREAEVVRGLEFLGRKLEALQRAAREHGDELIAALDRCQCRAGREHLRPCAACDKALLCLAVNADEVARLNAEEAALVAASGGAGLGTGLPGGQPTTITPEDRGAGPA